VDGEPRSAPADGPIDWDDSGFAVDVGVQADISRIDPAFCSGEDEGSLRGHDDWANVVYRFQDSPNFASGVHIANHPDPDVQSEQALQTAESMDFDGDGISNADDTCPADADDQEDLDGDGTGDACDLENLVAIDVKPGNATNSINAKANGTIQVAILSSAHFDAPARVDRSSLTFGAEGDEESLVKCAGKGEDVNGDGRLDLVCHFTLKEAGFASGDTTAVLRGETVGGAAFEGTDAVTVK
jgi:hypothetical protein